MAQEFISFTGRRYRVERQITFGAMGGSFLATNAATEQLVRLEFIPEALAPLEQSMRDVMRQVGIAVLDEGRAQQGYFLVLEYVQGKDLEQIIIERGALPVDEALRIVLQVAQALAKVHERGIVHRDIKPSNILVTQTGEPKLIDFGTATFAGREPKESLGTPGYAPPEQYIKATIDQRSDIFALGMTLYTLLTGVRSPGQPFVPADMSLVPDFVRPIIAKAIAIRPEERFQSAQELAIAIGQLLQAQVNMVRIALTEFALEFGWTFVAILGITLIGTLVYASRLSLFGIETSGLVLVSMMAVAISFVIARQCRKVHQF
jgi:serine/threonine protein kinase